MIPQTPLLFKKLLGEFKLQKSSNPESRPISILRRVMKVTKRQIVGILMLSPFYFTLALEERSAVVNGLCLSCAQIGVDRVVKLIMMNS